MYVSSGFRSYIWWLYMPNTELNRYFSEQGGRIIQVMRTSEFLRILWKPTLWLWWETPHWQTTQRSIFRTVFYVDFKSLWCSFLYLLEMCWTLFKEFRKHLVIMKCQDGQSPSQCLQRKQTMEGVHHSDPRGNKRQCKWGWNVREK